VESVEPALFQPGSTCGKSRKITFDVSQLKVGSNKGLITIKIGRGWAEICRFPSKCRKLKRAFWSTGLVPVGLVLVPAIQHRTGSFVRDIGADAGT